MTSFSRTWDAAYKADPADDDQASGGALDIRNTKIDIQERGEVDHSWAGDANDGAHKKITLVDPLGAKPTQANDETYIYTKDVSATSELFFEDESGNEVQLTNGGLAGEAFPSGTDMLFYEDTAPTGWTIVQAVDNHVIELTDGSANGGATGGTVTGSVSTETFFARTATDSHTLLSTESGVPAHTHGTDVQTVDGGVYGGAGRGGTQVAGQGGLSHPNTAADAASGHTHNIDCQLQRAHCIIATKD